MGQEKVGTFMQIAVATKKLVGELSGSVTTATFPSRFIQSPLFDHGAELVQAG